VPRGAGGGEAISRKSEKRKTRLARVPVDIIKRGGGENPVLHERKDTSKLPAPRKKKSVEFIGIRNCRTGSHWEKRGNRRGDEESDGGKGKERNRPAGKNPREGRSPSSPRQTKREEPII